MRREVTALQGLGWNVVRAAARPFAGKLVDAADRLDTARTFYTAHSVRRAAEATLLVAFRHPLKFATAVADSFRIGLRSRSGVWKHLMYVGQACALLRFVRECVHLHANFGNATSIAIMCRILGGPPVSLRIHGPEEFEALTAREWDWRARHSAFLAPISAFGAVRLREILAPRHHKKVHMLRCGVDAQVLDADRIPLPPALRVVCVARLEARKGHAVLLVATKLLRERGLDVHLRLVGEGSLRTALEQQVNSLGLRGHVSFDGWADGAQVLSAIGESRLLVLPSFAEGLPIVLMEALALCRPVVATSVAGIPELVIPGETGWLVVPGDPLALADAIALALRLPDDEIAEIVARGRRLVVENHSAAQLMALLTARIDESLQEEVSARSRRLQSLDLPMRAAATRADYSK